MRHWRLFLWPVYRKRNQDRKRNQARWYPEGSWLSSQLAEFFPLHRVSQGGLAHGRKTCLFIHLPTALRFLKPDQQETAFCLLLDKGGQYKITNQMKGDLNV
jgi:hypothetical protein